MSILPTIGKFARGTLAGGAAGGATGMVMGLPYGNPFMAIPMALFGAVTGGFMSLMRGPSSRDANQVYNPATCGYGPMEQYARQKYGYQNYGAPYLFGKERPGQQSGWKQALAGIAMLAVPLVMGCFCFRGYGGGFWGGGLGMYGQDIFGNLGQSASYNRYV